MKKYARPLNSNELAFDFLTKALLIDDQEADEASQFVMKAERLLEGMDLKSTLESKDNRRTLYKDDEKRKNLRRKIFDELKDEARLENDESISLGSGGARPKTETRVEKTAIIIIGLPASGKSTIAGNIADKYGAYIIDSDYAKRKIPEFGHEFGASIVHEESSLITFGSNEPQYLEEYSLYEYCIAKGYNMVIPKIGSDADSIRKLRDVLIEKEYSVHLVLVSLDREEACRRALYRYLDTQRYVPLGLVFDTYANEPILSYYRLREDKGWASVGKVSTLNLKTRGPEVIYSTKASPIEQFNVSGGVH